MLYVVMYLYCVVLTQQPVYCVAMDYCELPQGKLKNRSSCFGFGFLPSDVAPIFMSGTV